MDVTQLFDIAFADVDEQRIEVMTLEPAEISNQAVGGMTGVLREIAGIADAVLASGEKVVVGGSWGHDNYLISVSTEGPAASGDLITFVNHLLHDPELALGFASCARLAARHQVAVRLAHDGTVRLTVPAASVMRSAPSMVMVSEEPEGDFIPHEFEHRVHTSTGSPMDESEAFLESVFGALRDPWREPDLREPAVLQVRIPGESYSVMEDDSPSTAAGEAAVDIRSALSTFDQGRRSAEVSEDRVEATA